MLKSPIFWSSIRPRTRRYGWHNQWSESYYIYMDHEPDMVRVYRRDLVNMMRMHDERCLYHGVGIFSSMRVTR